MTKKLADFLARVFDRTQRILPTSVHRTVRTWLIQSDTIYLHEQYEIESVGYPAIWAPDSNEDQSKNIRWDLGVWAE